MKEVEEKELVGKRRNQASLCIWKNMIVLIVGCINLVFVGV